MKGMEKARLAADFQRKVKRFGPELVRRQPTLIAHCIRSFTRTNPRDDPPERKPSTTPSGNHWIGRREGTALMSGWWGLNLEISSDLRHNDGKNLDLFLG